MILPGRSRGSPGTTFFPTGIFADRARADQARETTFAFRLHALDLGMNVREPTGGGGLLDNRSRADLTFFSRHGGQEAVPIIADKPTKPWADTIAVPGLVDREYPREL